MGGALSLRQKWSRGFIVTVPLGDGSFAFGQMLTQPEYAFFDLRATVKVDPKSIVSYPVLFRLWVMRLAHSTGRWTKTGTAPIPESLSKSVYRFCQDPMDPSSIRLHKDGIEGPPVSVSDCTGLERAAVWDASHVEDRLRDHFARRPNKWVESMKVRGWST
jgi:hypothetical protein